MATSKKKYVYAVGRRKEATATVRLYRGKGQTLVNDKPIDEYFPGPVSQYYYQQPLVLTKTLGKFYATFKVVGGGKSGQLDAVVLALSRALEKVDREKYRPVLKEACLLYTSPSPRD